MNDFVEQFLNEDWEDFRDAPRLYVAAFGKHPAWNDHMDDIGLVTGSLVSTRRIIYGSGIASQIESAAWEKVGADKTVPTFDHVLLWRRGSESVVGRIWSSRDGKGRALYPMALVVHAIGQRLESLASVVMPELLKAEAKALEAKTPGPILALLNEAQETMRARAEAGPLGVPDSTLGVAAWTGWALREPTAFERVIHHLRGHVGDFLPERRTWCAAEGVAQSRTLRFPRCGVENPLEALNAWISFLATQIDPAVPLLGILHREFDWVDVIVGEPAANDLFVLRANTQAVPMVTDIPYQIGGDTHTAAGLVGADLAQRRLPTRSALNGRSLVENREAADRWLSRSRGAGTRGLFGRLLSGGGGRSSSRFDLTKGEGRS